MKILQVMAGARHGGAETAFVDMCIALHESGETVEVITRANDVRLPQLQQAGIKVHLLLFGGALDIFTPLRMTKIFKNFKPDIVQTWMARACAKTPPWRAQMGIPKYEVVARLGGYYKLKYFKNADYFMAITPDIMKYLTDNGVAPARIARVNNFAETERVEHPLSRRDFDTPDDAPLLLGLGRLHPSKAFDTLIQSVATLPGVYLWIAGEGPQRAELEKLIEDLGVRARVKLLGWRSDRAALFQAADVCTFTSRFEPFGTVFAQAWAQKVPLITTNADGPRQFVRDGEDGLIVPVDDEKALSHAIARMLGDKDLQARLVASGHQRYLDEFTKEKTVASYLAFYHRIHKSA